MTPLELYQRLHEASPERALEAAREAGAAHPSPVVVSACLVGVACRYDGADKGLPQVHRLLQGQKALPLCPEVLAGLGVPRPPMVFEAADGAAALVGATRLLDAQGRDCTADLARGARFAVRLAEAAGCERAVCKARSPSCGVHQVYTHAGLVPGCGMFTAACRDAGIVVCSDEDSGWPGRPPEVERDPMA